MPMWPATLPVPLYDGYAESEPDNYVEFTPSVGDPIRRQRSTAVTRPMQFTMDCTTTQVATLQDFYATDCAGGSLSFTGLTHPRTGATGLTYKFAGKIDWGGAYPSQGVIRYRATVGLLVLP